MSAPIEVSDSQFKTYQGCPRKWAYQKILKIEAQESKDAMHFGNAAHDGMEEFVKTGVMDKAIAASIKALTESKPTNVEYAKMLVPAMLIGWATHWIPPFIREYEYIALEQWFTSIPNPQVVHVRGFKDIVAKKRATGRRCVFDYKTTSENYMRDLIATLESNNQLARYTMAEWREFGVFPDEVGLVFLLKPTSKDINVACEKARTDAGLYKTLIQQVTPKFAEFAIANEQNDVLMAQQMQFYRDLVAERGPQACDYIPANFDNCFNYGSMCGYAGGCHAGHPAHRNLPPKA
jgi:PD-(D/E)XK nuclease superfamily